MKRLIEFLRNEEGATAPEYGLIVALVAVFIIGAVTALGGSVSAAFQAIADAIGVITPGTPPPAG